MSGVDGGDDDDGHEYEELEIDANDDADDTDEEEDDDEEDDEGEDDEVEPMDASIYALLQRYLQRYAH
jgi:hypothetical protein